MTRIKYVKISTKFQNVASRFDRMSSSQSCFEVSVDFEHEQKNEVSLLHLLNLQRICNVKECSYVMTDVIDNIDFCIHILDVNNSFNAKGESKTQFQRYGIFPRCVQSKHILMKYFEKF